jgi:DNA polymerase III alpha subunit
MLFMGLDQVRDLTKKTQLRILRLRPFGSFPDFLTRVDPRRVEAENLVKVGGLQGMGTIPNLLNHLGTGGWRRGQPSLFEIDQTLLSINSEVEHEEDDWSVKDKVAAQETILGTGVDAHPLELASDAISKAGAVTTVEAVVMVGQRVRVAGMRQTWRRGSTDRGERLYVMSLEDLDGMLNAVLYANVYQRYRREISGSGPYVVEGQVEIDQRVGEPYLRVERIWRL